MLICLSNRGIWDSSSEVRPVRWCLLWTCWTVVIHVILLSEEISGIAFENCTSTHIVQTPDDVLRKTLSMYGVHYNIQSVLDALHDPKYHTEEAVQVLLMKYEEAKQIAPKYLPPPQKRHPIISIDGFFTHGRAMITKAVSHAINGRRLQLPTRNINRLRKYFNSSILRKHFYSLSKYMGAHIASHYSRSAPVIIERYWHDQAVYVMARSFDGIITAKSSVYEFPSDLLKPDFVFFLNGALNPNLYNESTADRHIHNMLTVKMVEVYRRMRDPTPIEIFPPSMPEKMLKTILQILENRIQGTFLPKPAVKPRAIL